MAKNGAPGGGRIGAVKARSQGFNPVTKQHFKRNTETGQIMAVKKDGTPWKGVQQEKGS